MGAEMPVMSLSFSRVRFLSKGVAIEADCPELIRLHGALAAQWPVYSNRELRVVKGCCRGNI